MQRELDRSIGYVLFVLPVLGGGRAEFINVRAQESIPRKRFRQAMRLADRYVKQGCCTGPPGWESIPGLSKKTPWAKSEVEGKHRSRRL